MARRLGLLAAIAVCAAVLYEVRHASALGVPTLTTLAYNGSLMTFGAPDNSTHTMVLALFVVGQNDGGLGSAACTTTASITCVNGQFSIPLSASCVTVVQQNQNVQAEVTIDSIVMGMVSVTAVPYAIEAGTAASVSASNITGILPLANGGTNSSTQNFVDLTTNQTISGDKTFARSAVAVEAAASITIPNSTFINLPFATVDWDELGEYTASSGFTPLYTGIYQVCGSVYWGLAVSSEMDLFINGVRFRAMGGSNITACGGCVDVSLSAGQHATVSIYQTQAANETALQNSLWTYLNFHRLY